MKAGNALTPKPFGDEDAQIFGTKPSLPRGSTYTTIRELGPKIPYYRRNYGSQFLNGCICGPSGLRLKICPKALYSMVFEPKKPFYCESLEP